MAARARIEEQYRLVELLNEWNATGRAAKIELALKLIADGHGCDLLGSVSCGYDGCECAENLATALLAVINGAERCPDDCTPEAFTTAKAVIAMARAATAARQRDEQQGPRRERPLTGTQLALLDRVIATGRKDADAITRRVRRRRKMKIRDVPAALDRLVDRGYLFRFEDSYVLTAKGQAQLRAA